MNCPTCDSHNAIDFRTIQCCTCDHDYYVCKKCWSRYMNTYKGGNTDTFKFITKCLHCQSKVCFSCYMYCNTPQKCSCGMYQCELANPCGEPCDACEQQLGKRVHIVKRIYDNPCAYIDCTFRDQHRICCTCYIKGKEVKDILTTIYLDPGKIIYEYWGTDYTNKDYERKTDWKYCNSWRCTSLAEKLDRKKQLNTKVDLFK
jgi:hypothetical protein